VGHVQRRKADQAAGARQQVPEEVFDADLQELVHNERDRNDSRGKEDGPDEIDVRQVLEKGHA
jgi:hypothetical protein